MKKLSTIVFTALATVGVSQAQTTVTTQPVGFNTITALGNSDTRFSVPLQQAAVYSGLVQTLSGAGGNTVTVQGTPGWTTGPDQFVYVQGTQSNTYYVEFTSGNKVGMNYTVSDNGSNTLILNLNGDALDGTNGTAAVATGDSLTIIPYWTLSTMFPGQQGITGTGSIGGSPPATQILVPDVVDSGINLATNVTYFYYTGTSFGGAGWRKAGGGFSTLFNDAVLPPDLYVLIRQNSVPTSSVLVATGVVPTTTQAYVLGTIAANTPQDNAIAITIPVPLTLSQSNLQQSGAFLGTSNIGGNGGDQLLVFDDTVAGYNKANTQTYYYYTGTGFGGAGWRLAGGGFSTIQDSTVVFQPGSGYIVRKAATASPATFVWTVPTPY